jgi:hypothetical protein
VTDVYVICMDRNNSVWTAWRGGDPGSAVEGPSAEAALGRLLLAGKVPEVYASEVATVGGQR